ncbi:MAG: hypothetical protein KF729_30335 [Sandaracinaceae bacterium]|nr:hypothetical protein [Sandaracinaceae bacterium]
MRTLVAGVVACSLSLVGCLNGSPSDVSASTWNICCGANCCCIPGAGPLRTGDLNPANPCERCDPSRTPREWTAVPDCDAGMPGETDAGSVEEDAGTPGADAGGPPMMTDGGAPPVGTDAGTPPVGTDAGTPPVGTDAGTGDGGGDGCRAAPGAPAGPVGLALFAAAAALFAARRRR